MKFLEDLQRVFIFIILFSLLVIMSACGGPKTLMQTDNTPNLHDKYKMQVDQRIYGVLPLPEDFDKDDWVVYHILEYPRKGQISLQDRYKGFFNYTPREGAYGYDFFVYNVSDGKNVAKKIIQLNIKNKGN